MTQQKKHVPFSKLIAELERLCQKQSTGTLLLFSDDNRFAQIKLVEGEIVSIAYQNVHGVDAMPLIRQIKVGWSAFMEGPIAASESLKLSTKKIIEFLSGEGGNGSVPNAVPSASANDELTEEAKTVLKESLARFIGPVAEVIFSTHVRTAFSLRGLLEALADEIPDPMLALQYREYVDRKLKETD